MLSLVCEHFGYRDKSNYVLCTKYMTQKTWLENRNKIKTLYDLQNWWQNQSKFKNTFIIKIIYNMAMKSNFVLK